jgi:hypothetical protein
MVFIINPSAYFSSMPTIGADWTRADSTGQSIFTKVGSTATDGATFSVFFERSIGVGSVYEYIAVTYASNPTTSVTMWVPDPVIDWTGYTHVGSATLS